MNIVLKVIFDIVVGNIIKMLCGALVVVILLQIFSRIFFEQSIPWTEEVSRLIFIWLCTLASVMAAKKNMHIGIDYLYLKASKSVKKILDFIISALMAVFGVVSLVFGARLLDIVSNQSTELLRLPSSVYYSSVPLAGALFIILAMSRIIELFHKRDV